MKIRQFLVTGVTTLALLTASISVGTPAKAVGDNPSCGGDLPPSNVTPGNRPPVLVDEHVNMIAGDAVDIDLLANDVDPDGDTLVIVGVECASKGSTFLRSDGVLAYWPKRWVSGTETILVAVTDGEFYRTETITIEIEGVTKMTPKVVRKLTSSQRAKIKWPNKNERTMLVTWGRTGDSDASGAFRVWSGGTKIQINSRNRIDFIAYVKNDNGEWVFRNSGSVYNRTGVVK